MPNEDDIVISDGKVDSADEEKLTPPLAPAEDLTIQPKGDDGKPIVGANVTLECQDPDRTRVGVEEVDGAYTFKDALRANGSDKCVLRVEKPG